MSTDDVLENSESCEVVPWRLRFQGKKFVDR